MKELDEEAIVEFILASTTVQTPSLVPELRMRLASEVMPLWHATEHAIFDEASEPPYWAFCWPGGQALARFALDCPERFGGRRVLDFAAGSGIAAIAAAKTGADASACDIDPLAQRVIGLNAALNGVVVRGEVVDVQGWSTGRWDLVLAGDVCYQRGMAESVIAWFRRLAAAGTEVLLADPGRAYLPAQGLESVARYVVPTSPDLEDRERRDCVIWRVLP